jgi:WD and tetratricopeptide repeat-containing protein 1
LKIFNFITENNKYIYIYIYIYVYILQANQYFDKQEYTAAINFYNYAIHIFKSSSVLFSNRAAAYIKRKWQGDYYAALKDCVTALKLDPDHMKAHFRLIVCLYELRMLDDSKMYLEEFKKRFPSYNTSEAFLTIHSNIHHSIRRKKEALIEGNHYIDILICLFIRF